MIIAEATHPLEEALAPNVGENEGHSGPELSFGRPSGPGWYFVSDLLNDEDKLNELLGLFGKHVKTERPFLQAALFMSWYTHLFVPDVVYALYTLKRVPDVSAENFAFRLDSSGEIVGYAFCSRRFAALPSDSAATHADAVTVPDFESLVAWMFERMIERHIRPLFSHVRAQTKLGMNVVWASVATCCVGAIMRLQRAGFFTVEEAVAEKTSLLDRGPEPLRERLSVYPLTSGDHQALFMRVEVCCQKHLHPDMGKCGYCALRPIPEQREMQQYYFDRHVAELERENRASNASAGTS